MLRLRRSNHHGVLDIGGSEHLRLGPGCDARCRVQPVRQMRGRINELGDLCLSEADRPTARAVPPSKRLYA